MPVLSSAPGAPEIDVEFLKAGHLLGSAYARVRICNRTILFGGDLGRYGRPVLPDPTPVEAADVLLVESTYGDKTHPPDDDGAGLAGIVNDTVARGGKLIIPAFAVGRVEELLYWLEQLEDGKRIPVLPVYVDSPMAENALQFYRNRTEELDRDIHTDAARGVRAFATGRLKNALPFVVCTPRRHEGHETTCVLRVLRDLVVDRRSTSSRLLTSLFPLLPSIVTLCRR